ncbi:hypothetical protein RJ640_026236 [Escallonia rubra]|uniref:NAB domain-containing protein n=1 Tax=Escallonia rubra TaxID=112253 RepID=A0AA88UHD5_9ASTE|nr:hypothetical protein RJ640_026236 [Escallonia rubra]
MEIVEPKSRSSWWDSHMSPETSKWLAENIEGVDQSVKHMLKLIEDDENSPAKGQRRMELIANVEEFCHLHRLLAERYGNLTGELSKNFASLPQLQHPEISGTYSPQASQLLTPDQKSARQKAEQAVNFDFLLSSGGGSSDMSLKEYSESASSSSMSSDSDTESRSSMKKRLVLLPNGDGNGLHQKPFDLETKQETIDGTPNMIVTDYEEELRIKKKMLQFSDEEIARLKGELTKNDSVTVLLGDLQAQLQSAHHDNKVLESTLEMEKRKVLELQNQVAELETRICDSDCKTGTLEYELEVTREKLRTSEEEISALKKKLHNEASEGTRELQRQLQLRQREIAFLEAKLDSGRSKTSELQEKIVRYIDDASHRDHEIEELTDALRDVRERFSAEKAELQSDISSILEEQNHLKARLGEWEVQNGLLEVEIKQCKAEKLELKGLQEAQEIIWQADIERLNADLKRRDELVETLNKNLDLLKLKYDTLMAEKDGVSARVDTLNAELRAGANQVRQTEGRLSQLYMEHVELIAKSESTQRLTDELKLRVEELKEEVDMQRAVLSDRAEEKREAIRQLCFSLEHYRSGYQALREACIGYKARAVLAS